MTEKPTDVQLSLPDITDADIEHVTAALRSGWLTSGPYNRRFEEAFAAYIGVDHALSVNSCASALHLAIVAAGVEGEVILPSFTFVASANAVVTAGATPVFVDVDYDTCNISPAAIEAAITSRTEAIMPVHFGGQVCNMSAIMDIADRHHLVVIEDSAECIGGTHNGRKGGSFGVGCFSFYPTKNITTSEGGMLVTNDAQLARKAATCSRHGIPSTTSQRHANGRLWERAAVAAGYNFRMPNPLAALGLSQLSRVDGLNELRRQHAERYRLALQDLAEFIDLPLETPENHHVYQMYTIKVKHLSRDQVMEELWRHGVRASVHFAPPVHLQPYYQRLTSDRLTALPVTERLSESMISLPMYPGLTHDEQDRVVEALRSSVQAYAGVVRSHSQPPKRTGSGVLVGGAAESE